MAKKLILDRENAILKISHSSPYYFFKTYNDNGSTYFQAGPSQAKKITEFFGGTSEVIKKFIENKIEWLNENSLLDKVSDGKYEAYMEILEFIKNEEE